MHTIYIYCIFFQFFQFFQFFEILTISLLSKGDAATPSIHTKRRSSKLINSVMPLRTYCTWWSPFGASNDEKQGMVEEEEEVEEGVEEGL